MNIPKINNIEHIEFVQPAILKLSNNIPIFIFNDGNNPIIKMDVVFDAGRWTEDQKFAADAMAALSKSGTERLSSFLLNEEIDKLGATIKISTGFNTCTLSLSCLSKFLAPCLDLVMTCLTDIIFPEDELDIFKKNAKAKLSVNNEKTDYLAGVIFRESIFGTEHPYGYKTTDSIIDRLSRETVFGYYNNNLLAQNCSIFIAGDVNAENIKLIENVFTAFNKTGENPAAKTCAVSPANHTYIRQKKEKSAQASLAIGKVLFNKKNTDYAAFLLLNTIFGGYFGSRLMNNIREDKGLTYGIYSTLNPLKNNGYWGIYTDTNIHKLDICLKEIHFELEKIQNEPIAEQEIVLARNYLLGRFLKRTDGAFNLMETYKSYVIEGVDIQSFSTFIEEIKQADASILQEIAKKYLSLDTMHQVIVG
jgi:predicted Zn-dependent peptidase